MTPPDRYERARRVRWDETQHVCSPLLERAALVQEATGCSWDEADERAWALEGPQQRSLFEG